MAWPGQIFWTMIVVGVGVWSVGCGPIPTAGGPELHTVLARDGWKLAVRRQVPATPRRDAVPIILCHGSGLNGRFWNLTPETSLVEHLSRQGYDVWVVNLRGAGESERPVYQALRDLLSLNPRRVSDVQNSVGTNWMFEDWNLDEHADYDVPAIIDYVKATSGKSAVAWVGHSMGGMILYALQQRRPRSDIAAAVMIGSPAVLVQPYGNGVRLLQAGNFLAEGLNLVVGLAANSQWNLATGGVAPTLLDRNYFHLPNTDPIVFQETNRLVIEDIGPSVLAQLIKMVDNETFLSFDGRFDYAAGLKNYTVPTLLIAGSRDKVAPPSAMRATLELLGSPVKRLFLAGADRDGEGGYGHCDLVLGRDAPREVWPEIDAWLAQHACQPAAAR